MDWNNDGKKDLIVGDTGGKVRIFLNTGADESPTFKGFTYLQADGVDFVSIHAEPEIIDWNNDGKKDVLCGGAGGCVCLLLNSGSDATPSFGAATLLQNAGTDITFLGHPSSPVVADWNRDGKKDLLAGSSDGNVYYFENKGTDDDPLFNGCMLLTAGEAPINVERCSKPDVVDWNGDGLKDLLVGCVDGGVWFYRAINPALPCLSLADLIVNDSSGNTNGLLNPGETAQIVVSLTNQAGAAAAKNVRATLSSITPCLAITSPQSSFGDIGSNTCGRNSFTPFSVTVATNGPQDSFYSFDLAVSHDDGAATDKFSFVVGDYSINSNALYSWVDTSSGTNISLSYGSHADIYLPFPFPFYGQVQTQVLAFDNGYLMFGSPFWQAFNSSIPSPDPPNAVVAPFWSAQYHASNGAVRVLYAGSAPNRYFAIEWNQVPYYGPSGSLTLEAILFENGLIKFQYGPIDGSTADGSSATIGIESYDGSKATQYSYNQPGVVHSGLAIEFNMSGVFEDSNSNGMPDKFDKFYFGDVNVSGAADSDGDGMNNADEIRCGTDPTDPRSVLKLEDISALSTNRMVVNWQCIPGMPYYVASRTNITIGSRSNLNQTPVYGNANGTGYYTATVGSAKGAFFRVSLP